MNRLRRPRGAPAALGAFGAGLVLALGLGYGVGAAVGPVGPAETGPAEIGPADDRMEHRDEPSHGPGHEEGR